MAKSLTVIVTDLSLENKDDFGLIIPGFLRGTISANGEHQRKLPFLFLQNQGDGFLPKLDHSTSDSSRIVDSSVN